MVKCTKGQVRRLTWAGLEPLCSVGAIPTADCRGGASGAAVSPAAIASVRVGVFLSVPPLKKPRTPQRKQTVTMNGMIHQWEPALPFPSNSSSRERNTFVCKLPDHRTTVRRQII